MVKQSIANYIKKSGIKQKFICEKTGMSQQALCSLLKGKRNLEIDEYICLCDALGVDYTLFMKKTS